uniref:Uncharacterized protein n=1 Tax=Romanomermis culicivorax TaxID=13658 RepID=A0A915KE04_ROMCU
MTVSARHVWILTTANCMPRLLRSDCRLRLLLLWRSSGMKILNQRPGRNVGAAVRNALTDRRTKRQTKMAKIAAPVSSFLDGIFCGSAPFVRRRMRRNSIKYSLSIVKPSIKIKTVRPLNKADKAKTTSIGFKYLGTCLQTARNKKMTAITLAAKNMLETTGEIYINEPLL